MKKTVHEIRDPIHNFIKLNSDERQVLNSRPLQRLRHIHQLALTYLVYPGASHKRFEHSLGVMELATKIFDTITSPTNVTDSVRNHFPDLLNRDYVAYWRKVLRMAALCHDFGHLPFSHAAENKLLKDSAKHEHYTYNILLGDEMKNIFSNLTPPVIPEDVVRIAVGKKIATNLPFTKWHEALSEIIINDSLGADRMDYLLRDSHHIGVAYGKFDHIRLIDCLRLLVYNFPSNGVIRPTLGIELGGIHAAEAMSLARYYMYQQVYFHQVRRIYDLHLTDFLAEWLPEGHFPDDIEGHLNITDNEVNSALLKAKMVKASGYIHADRILSRKHFKLVHRQELIDQTADEADRELMYNGLSSYFQGDLFKFDYYRERSGIRDFPVLLRSGQIESSVNLSKLLKGLPVASVFYIFADEPVCLDIKKWIRANQETFYTKKTRES